MQRLQVVSKCQPEMPVCFNQCKATKYLKLLLKHHDSEIRSVRTKIIYSLVIDHSAEQNAMNWTKYSCSVPFFFLLASYSLPNTCLCVEISKSLIQNLASPNIYSFTPQCANQIVVTTCGGTSAVQCFPWLPPVSKLLCPAIPLIFWLLLQYRRRRPVACAEGRYRSAVNTINCEVYYILICYVGTLTHSFPLGCPLEQQRNEKVRSIYRGTPREPNHRRGRRGDLSENEIPLLSFNESAAKEENCACLRLGDCRTTEPAHHENVMKLLRPVKLSLWLIKHHAFKTHGCVKA